MPSSFSTFIGVDLGGGKGKNTAVARLQLDGDGVIVVDVGTKTPSGKPFFDAALVSYILEHSSAALLAIDAPLSPSVCFRCRLEVCPGLQECPDPVARWFRERAAGSALDGRRKDKPPFTAYTQRACEVLLKERYGIFPREALGQGMGPLTARAHYLRRFLAGEFVLNVNLLEVYPKATLFALFGAHAAEGYKRGATTWRVRASILERLADTLRFEVWREGCLKNDHSFDAVLCAYTGYLWAKQGWSLPEEDRAVFEQDGWIWFPPMPPTSAER
jgi:predicted nuclease with RNAse H fold